MCQLIIVPDMISPNGVSESTFIVGITSGWKFDVIPFQTVRDGIKGRMYVLCETCDALWLYW